MEFQTCVAIGAVDNPLNFVWLDDVGSIDLEEIAEQLGVEEMEIVDCEGPFSSILKKVNLADLVEIHEILCENYDVQLHLYIACIGVGYALNQDLREVALECSERFYGVYDSFEEFVETQIDDLVEIPDWIRPYFDIERFSRDLEQDYIHCDTEDRCVAVWRNQ